MPSLQPGDHPLIDMLIYGQHPFPEDIEDMLRKLFRIEPSFVGEDTIPYSEYMDWKVGQNLDSGREKLTRMLRNRGGEIDRIVEEGFEQLQKILARITLTPEERQFVEDIAKTLHQHSFDLLIAYPGYQQFRPIIVAVALAFWLGPSSVWERCMDSL